MSAAGASILYELLAALFYAPIVSVLLIVSAFSLSIRRLERRGAFLAAWAMCSLVLGYLWYIATCAMPLTCDVGGVAYWRTILPRATLLWSSAFGAAALTIGWMHARRSAPVSWKRALLGGAVGTVGFVVGQTAFYLFRVPAR